MLIGKNPSNQNSKSQFSSSFFSGVKKKTDAQHNHLPEVVEPYNRKKNEVRGTLQMAMCNGD